MIIVDLLPDRVSDNETSQDRLDRYKNVNGFFVSAVCVCLGVFVCLVKWARVTSFPCLANVSIKEGNVNNISKNFPLFILTNAGLIYGQ